MKKKPPSETKFTPNRLYKHDRAMDQAAKRARANQPSFISMSSKVKEFSNAK